MSHPSSRRRRRGVLPSVSCTFATLVCLAANRSGLAQPASTDWQDYIAGPTTRLVQPAAISFSQSNNGSITNPTAVLVEDGSYTTITRSGSNSPRLAVDFGLPVSGKIEIVFGDTVTAPLGIAFSQRLEFLDIGSDTSAFHLGDLDVTGRPGITWRTDNRRGFRYVLLYLPVNGTVKIDAIRVYHTPYLGSPDTYDGHFLCDNDLFNRIWYGCIYTVEISTTSGNDIDGPWEIEEGMLSISWEGDQYDPGGPFGFTVPGDNWTDYALDFDFRIMPLGRTCGWAFRAQDRWNCYMWQIVATEGGPNANTLRKHLYQNGNWTWINTVPLPFNIDEGTVHHVRTELEGSTIRTYLDSQLIDTTVDNTFTSGRIGFYSDEANREHFHVDNVIVSDAGGTLFSDDFEGEFLVADWNDWERAELNCINDGAKRDRVWVWGDFYPAQRAMWVAHWEPDIIAETMRDGAVHQYDQSVEDRWGPILRGKIPAANATGNHYMTADGFAVKWLDDYTFWWVLTLHHYWLHTGDGAFVQEMFPALQGVLNDWCVRKMRGDGLIQLQQGDWYWSMLRMGGVTSFNSLYVQSLRRAADMADFIGQSSEAGGWRTRANNVVTAMNNLLWNSSEQLYYDSVEDHGHHPLDGNTLPIIWGIAPPSRIGPILDRIETRMWSSIGTRTAWPGYLGSWGHVNEVWPWYVQFEVEARFQHHDNLRAFEAIRRPWELMVDGDPGRTVWEFIDDDGGVEQGLRNTDHAFSSGAAWLLSEYVAGIRPTLPGFLTYDIIPHPGELTWVQCTMPTPQGGISIEYHLDPVARTFDADIVSPTGTNGRVAVPRLDERANVWLDGQLVWTVSGGGTGGAYSDDRYLYFTSIGPGPHTISAAFFTFASNPDFDNDGDVDIDDYNAFATCYTGPVGEPAYVLPSGACLAAFDFDADEDIDCTDWIVFTQAWTGPGPCPPPMEACDDDCNGNGVSDVCESAKGFVADCDNNGVPDSCEPDSDGDGVIDGCDLCPNTIPAASTDADGCPPLIRGDMDRDGDVDMDDQGLFQRCLTGPGETSYDPDCVRAKIDDDYDVDQSDQQFLINCLSGANIPAPAQCEE